jgi:Fic-DOC domain mobile mystery protein B
VGGIGRFDSPPGATPLDDVEGLLIAGLTTQAELNEAEARNILKARDVHLRRKKSPKRSWLTETFLKRVHKAMFDEVWEWAGTFRTKELNIGVRPFAIPEEVRKLCDDAAFWASEGSMPVLERAVRLHHRLTQIHPFRNGNGRHARLMADIYLRSHGLRIPIWPAAELIGSSNVRDEYIRAVRAADLGDYEALTTFTQRYIV